MTTEPAMVWPSGAELLKRCLRLQDLMRRSGLNGALFYGNSNLLYLCGTTQAGAVFVPIDGEPLVLARPPLDRLEAETPWPLVEPLPRGRDLRTRLEAYLGGSLKGLGLELDLLPVNFFRRLEKESFLGLEMKDAAPLIRQARSVKTEFELGHMRTAARELDRVYVQIPGLLAPGLTEMELEGRLVGLARARGHHGLIRAHGFNQEWFCGHVLSGSNGMVQSKIDSPTGGTGVSPGFGHGAGPRVIGPDELVSVDLFGAYGGYMVDQTRLFFTGPVPETVRTAYQGLVMIHREMRDFIRPGVLCAEVYNRAFELAEREGLADGFMAPGSEPCLFVGHGIGLEVDEPPILARGVEAPLIPGMTFAFEPRVFLPGLGVVGLEDTYLLTEDGPEPITVTDREIKEVP